VEELAHLRRREAALGEGSYDVALRPAQADSNTLAFVRSADSDQWLIVLHDDASSETHASVPCAANDGSRLEDELHRGAPATLTVAGGKLGITMPPLTAGIYRMRGR
jgi:hypothetical protein